MFRSRPMRCMALAALVSLMASLVGGGRSAAQEVLTNESVLNMVRAKLPESVIIQKIRSSQRKFDTSSDALIKLKGAGVPDKVIEAMVSEPGATSPPAAQSAPPATAAEPLISHATGGGEKQLKPVYGNMQIKVEPFAGARQEVVLPEPRAQYRIAEKQPVFSTPQAAEQWILAKLKPGKRDRNLPMSQGGGWGSFGGTTLQFGVDPKYVIKLAAEPGPQGATRLKPVEPLAPGEYGFVAVARGQANLVEVFDFGVE